MYAFRPCQWRLISACHCHREVNVLDIKTNPENSPSPTSHSETAVGSLCRVHRDRCLSCSTSVRGMVSRPWGLWNN